MTEQGAQIEKLEKENLKLRERLEREVQERYAVQAELGDLKRKNDKFIAIIENLSKGRN